MYQSSTFVEGNSLAMASAAWPRPVETAAIRK
jgi:hypothetical protein